jgi:hypothetical protein
MMPIDLSATRISTFLACRRKFWFQYVENLRPVRRDRVLSLGSAVHAGIEAILRAGSGCHLTPTEIGAAIIRTYKPDEVQQAGTDPQVALECCLAFDRAVNWRAWSIREVETEWSVKIGRGRILRGRFDGIIEHNGGLYILEHKTVDGAVSERRLNHLLWDTQASLYVLAARELGHKVAGVMYSFIPKPTIDRAMATPIEKRKYKANGELYASQRLTDETEAEYVQRVSVWYSENANLFRQHLVTRNDSQIRATRKLIEQMSLEMRTAKRVGLYYPNPQACSVLSCPFSSVCLEDTPELRETNFAIGAEVEEQAETVCSVQGLAPTREGRLR